MLQHVSCLKTCEVKSAERKSTNTVCVHLNEAPRIGKFMGKEWRMPGSTGQWLTGTDLQLGKMKTFWKWVVVTDANNMNVLNATEVCTQTLENSHFTLFTFYHTKNISVYAEIVYANNMTYGELFLFSWHHVVSPGPHSINMTSLEGRGGLETDLSYSVSSPPYRTSFVRPKVW